MKTRGLLEPLKFLAPRELLLRVTLVCRQWSGAAGTEEVWRELCEAQGFRGIGSWRESYKKGWMMAGHVVFLWKQEVALYDCRAETWKTRIQLQKKIQACEGSSHCFLRNCDILMCGGGTIRQSSPQAWQISPYDGAVVSLRCMQKPRKYHGITLFQDTVFVFGGIHSLIKLSSVEAYIGETWQIIGKMKAPRMAFQPCISNKIVYLAGGQTTKIETFDPQTLIFTELNPQLQEASRSCAFLYNDQILILTASSLSLLTNSLHPLETWGCRNYENSGDSPVVVVKGTAFFPVANWSVLVEVCKEEKRWQYREIHLSTSST